MIVFNYEFKMLRKSIFLWVLAVATFCILYTSFFPTFGSDAELLDKILENYPEEMLKAFGMNTGLSLSTLPGYFAFVFMFVQILLAIQASNYGFSILSIEERDLTADFLMTKPVSRTEIIASKFLAVVAALTITNVATWVFGFLALEIFKDGKSYDLSDMVVLFSSIVLFQLFYLTVGMLISVSVKKIRSVISYSMALAFGTYMINAIRGMIDSDILGWFTPFYHFEPNYILANGAYDTSTALVSVVIIVIAFIGTYILYLKRNIHSL